MKIGIDARLWNESGVGRYVRNLITRFNEKKDLKHDFVIFLNSNVYNEIHFENPHLKKVKANIRWHGMSEQLRFKGIIEREQVDLMHFPYFSYPILYKKPFVITIHDLIIDHYPTGKASSLPLPLYYVKHFAYKKITEAAIKNSQTIIVPSEATKAEVMDHYHAKESKIKVIYEGFDREISGDRTTKLPSNKYILYVGNAYPHKNLPVLLEAYSMLRKKNEDIDLICIGRDDFFYKKLEHHNYPGVQFLHNVDDSTLFDYYNNASFFVMPSLMEGFGLPILEAMSLSCPVICSNTPALKEIGGDAVLYFDPHNASELEEKMFLLLNNYKLNRELTDKGLKRSRQFSWDKAVTETLQVYESSDSV